MAPTRHRGRSRPPSHLVHPRSPEGRKERRARPRKPAKPVKHGRDDGEAVRRPRPSALIIIYRRDSLGRFAPGRQRLARRRRPALPIKKAPGKPVTKPVRKPAKPVRKPAKPSRKTAKPARLARKPAKPIKPVRKTVKPAKPARKPARKVPRRLPIKKVPRKPPAKPARKVPRKPPAEPVKKKRKRRRKGPIPILSEMSRQADTEMQVKLVWILEYIEQMFPGMDMAIKTFINADGTVDGELRIGNLTQEWQGEDGSGWMVAALSEMFRAFPLFDKQPDMGGRFWISFGVRFGPQNDADLGELAELYKRFRGMFQTGSYPSPADDPVRIQLALVGLKTIMDGVMREHGLSHAVILIRFIWTFKRDKKDRIEQPGRYKDELGDRE